MFRSQALALGVVVAVATNSAASFQVGSQGRVMWEGNCDYYGDDIYSVKGIPDVCGDLCADDSSCTHWTWTYFEGGTCWLKSGSKATKSTYWGGGCGYVIKRFSAGSGSTDQTSQSGKTGKTGLPDQNDDQTSKASQTDQTTTTYDNGLTSTETNEMLDSINAYRAENGLSALTIDTRLVAAALVHSKDQANQCKMTHDGSDGSKAWDRMEDQGYDWTVAAENVAAGQESVSDVMTSWWNSAGHRANILKDDVTNVGFALAVNSGCSNYAKYWTQDFGAE